MVLAGGYAHYLGLWGETQSSPASCELDELHTQCYTLQGPPCGDLHFQTPLLS